MNNHNVPFLGLGILGAVVLMVSIFTVDGLSHYGSASVYASQPLQESAEGTHVETPSDGVRALYMSSWVAGREDLREPIIQLIEDTSLNAVVLDIKDVTGKISYLIDHPKVVAFAGSGEDRIRDLEEFINELHAKDIYVIGRIAVFQDAYAPKLQPAFAVQKANEELWEDDRGLYWFDAGSEDVWEYIVAIAEDAYERGFDEINLDYVRYPSDGNVSAAVFPVTGEANKPETLREFFAYIDHELRFIRDIPVSADIFGATTTAYHDIGVGQILEKIAPYVDAIGPMIYPSHYPRGFNGYDQPSAYPYEIITAATIPAIERLEALGIEPATSLRPWIQDFDLYGVEYTPERVRAQIEALEDLGIMNFMVWDPSNKYTDEAYYPYE